MAPEKVRSFPVQALLKLEHLPFDIFLKLDSGRRVQVGKKGQPVLKENLLRYEEKGAHQVLVRERDFFEFENQKKAPTRPPAGSASSQVESSAPGAAEASHLSSANSTHPQVMQLRGMGEKFQENFLVLGFKEEDLLQTQQVARSAQKFLEESEPLSALLDQIHFFEDPLAEHALAVAECSVMIAQAQGWEQPSSFHALYLGGLLHDVGLLLLPEKVRRTALGELTAKELRLYQTHPVLGFKALQKIPGLAKEVLSIVLEHHEGPGGFPKELSESQIHPMARLVALADQFVDRTQGSFHSPAARALTAGAALDELVQVQSGLFSEQDLTALRKLAST